MTEREVIEAEIRDQLEIKRVAEQELRLLYIALGTLGPDDA